MKKIYLGIILLILSLSLLACNNKETYTLDGVKKKGKIIMGTSGDYPPNEFHIIEDGKDKLVGSDIELGKYIANKLGVDLEIKEMEFSNLLSSLEVGQIDMIIAGMGKEKDRDINFTISYEKNGGNNTLLIRKEDYDKYLDLEALAGKTIGAQTGSIQRKLLDDIANINIKELPGLDVLLMELKTKKIDAIVITAESGDSYTKVDKSLALVESIKLYSDDSSGAAIGIKKGNDGLTEEVNKIIKEVKDKGLYEEWKAHWKSLSDLEIEKK